MEELSKEKMEVTKKSKRTKLEEQKRGKMKAKRSKASAALGRVPGDAEWE